VPATFATPPRETPATNGQDLLRTGICNWRRLGFNLPDALACDLEDAADFFDA